MNPKRGLGAAVIASLTVSSACVAQTTENLVLSASLDMDSNAKAGSISAGMLCLPNGSVRVSDFLRSQRDFATLAQDVFEEKARDQPEVAQKRLRFSLGLRSIQARLCARKYGAFGMGDRRSLSGEATFLFRTSIVEDGISSGDQSHEVRLRIPKGEPLTFGEISAAAVRSLANIVLTNAISKPPADRTIPD